LVEIIVKKCLKTKQRAQRKAKQAVGRKKKRFYKVKTVKGTQGKSSAGIEWNQVRGQPHS